jgi:hypothetical protein
LRDADDRAEFSGYGCLFESVVVLFIEVEPFGVRVLGSTPVSVGFIESWVRDDGSERALDPSGVIGISNLFTIKTSHNGDLLWNKKDE